MNQNLKYTLNPAIIGDKWWVVDPNIHRLWEIKMCDTGASYYVVGITFAFPFPGFMADRFRIIPRG
ncbi:hypothetical protein IX84_02260 [Phaeodactylibacter xiamenensis]|uniref:Uncharacterized protein n=1 Tax=Phaeodactylibacter xiamenensis TaxID=1524460 RepID=A0A098SBE6_9BACT|nr:hypothetical protein IX84_02260 [Phaeodactylibacter xiamenensis]